MDVEDFRELWPSCALVLDGRALSAGTEVPALASLRPFSILLHSQKKKKKTQRTVLPEQRRHTRSSKAEPTLHGYLVHEKPSPPMTLQ